MTAPGCADKLRGVPGGGQLGCADTVETSGGGSASGRWGESRRCRRDLFPQGTVCRAHLKGVLLSVP